MVYFLVALAVLLAGLLLAGAGCGARPDARHGEKPEVQMEEIKSASRDEIRSRLEALAAGKPPRKLNPGAMCYKPVGPPERIEYVCPACGEKTIYGHDRDDYDSLWTLDRELTACRRLIKKIKGLKVKLDESAFCRKCRPQAEKRQLVLVVEYPGEKPHRVAGVGLNDLKLIEEFMSGKTVHTGTNDNESPLKNHMARLRELLGVAPPPESPAGGS